MVSGARLDYRDEALRLFGSASRGQSITAHRALQGNRIFYDSAGNLYPDEAAVRHFRLDCAEKKAGDFSIRFEPAVDSAHDEMGFMRGPYQRAWNLTEGWVLSCWLRVEATSVVAEWPLALVDDRGRRAEGRLSGVVADGKSYRWDKDHTILLLADNHVATIIEAGRVADYATLEDFMADVLDSPPALHRTVVPGDHILEVRSGPVRKFCT